MRPIGVLDSTKRVIIFRVNGQAHYKLYECREVPKMSVFFSFSWILINMNTA